MPGMDGPAAADVAVDRWGAQARWAQRAEVAAPAAGDARRTLAAPIAACMDSMARSQQLPVARFVSGGEYDDLVHACACMHTHTHAHTRVWTHAPTQGG